MNGYEDHTWGVFSAAHGPVAAYARWSDHFGGFVVYNASTGRQLTDPHRRPAPKTLEQLVAMEPFKPNVKEPARVENEIRPVGSSVDVTRTQDL